MSSNHTTDERKTTGFGASLIADMKEGLEALRSGKQLRTTYVPAPPPEPPAFTKKRLVALRKRYAMSQTGFALILNVSPKTIESWEQGVRKPSGAASRLLQVLETPQLLPEMALPRNGRGAKRGDRSLRGSAGEEEVIDAEFKKN